MGGGCSDAAGGPEAAAALAALLVPSVQEAKGAGVYTQLQALDYLGGWFWGWGCLGFRVGLLRWVGWGCLGFRV